jgi:hypothetical protein
VVLLAVLLLAEEAKATILSYTALWLVWPAKMLELHLLVKNCGDDGPYTGLLGARSNVAQESALGQFDVARQKDLTSAGLQTGIASQLASSAIGLGEAAGKAKLATEMLGPETAASLAKQFGTTAGALQQVGLQGETQLLLPTATAAAQTGLEAAKTRNQQLLATTQTNLNIAKAQEDTRNALVLQRGQFAGQRMLQEAGAARAWAAHNAFA